VALIEDDAEREAERVRTISMWPGPWLAMKRTQPGGAEFGLIFADDIEPPERNSQAADCVRMFEATDETAITLMNPNGVIDGSKLAVLAEYDSVEQMIADGWQVDG